MSGGPGGAGRPAPPASDPSTWGFTEERRALMGTWCRVSICHEPRLDPAARDAVAAAFREMVEVEARLSRFREDSDVARFGSGRAEPEHLSGMFRRVLRRARRLRALTRGAYDAEVAGKLDLGGMGKGTAVDAAVRRLLGLGFRDFLVDAGGDLHAAGRHAGSPWTVCLPLPFEQSALALLAVEDLSVATSGTEARGEHVVRIAPDPGGIAGTSLQVCVVGPSAETADALATAIMSAGPGRGEFMRRFPEYEALVLDEADRVHLTPGFRRHVRPMTRQHAELL